MYEMVFANCTSVQTVQELFCVPAHLLGHPTVNREHPDLIVVGLSVCTFYQVQPEFFVCFFLSLCLWEIS